MRAPIPGLYGSPTHELAVLQYRRHVGIRSGLCAFCGGAAPCIARRNAGVVIVAAGDDPQRFDDIEPIPDPGWNRPTAQQKPIPDHEGFHVARRNPQHDPGAERYPYDRDDY